MSHEISNIKSFEQNYPIESERKLIPLRPEILVDQYQHAEPVEQAYLSHPDEEYSLRIRRHVSGKSTKYTPTLKDRGEIVDGNLVRLEANGTMSEDRYNYYFNNDLPVVNKLRYERDGISVDYFDGQQSNILVESENPVAWRRFLDENNLSERDFEDVTGQKIADNEWRAHESFRMLNGHDAFDAPTTLEADEIVDDIVSKLGRYPLIATLGGRSGSGKSTLLRQVDSKLKTRGVTTSTLSTDDYNKGRTHRKRLSDGEWTNYDANETYDLPLCYLDLKQLREGLTIPKREYDFETEEPKFSGERAPADVILVEGIKAQHPLIMEAADLSFTMPTSLALSIGRRIMRDLKERPRFADPGTNLSVYLEYAEPEYRALL